MKDDADKRVAYRLCHQKCRGHHLCALLSYFLRRTGTHKVRTPRRSRRVAAAPSGSPDAHMCPGQGAQVIRAWEPGYQSAEVAVLKLRVWRVCARCHRNKKSVCAILRSGSELI